MKGSKKFIFQIFPFPIEVLLYDIPTHIITKMVKIFILEKVPSDFGQVELRELNIGYIYIYVCPSHETGQKIYHPHFSVSHGGGGLEGVKVSGLRAIGEFLVVPLMK
jgi:hypothetical protein